MRPRTSLATLCLALLLGGSPFLGIAQIPDTTSADTAQTETEVLAPFDKDSDVPYVPTPTNVVDSMLALADVTSDDVVYDLGSGDGRFVIRAAKKFGARGVGIEIKPELVEKARKNAQEAGVADRVEFRQGDMFEADISDATVVTLYLLSSVNRQLRPKLFEELSPGTRVVSHDFDMGAWKPKQKVDLGSDVIYLWTIPENKPSLPDM